MAAHVLRHAGKSPDKIALAVLGPARAERWSYALLEASVRGTATGLLRAGLRPGDRVLLRLGNTPDFPIAYLACIAVGVLPVPTAPGLTEEEVDKQAAILEPACALHDPALACPASLRRIPLDDLRGWRDLPPADFLEGDPDRPAYIVFTSGTSGTPRAVEHAHRAIWARGMMHAGWYGMTGEDRILHAGGFNWTFTLGTGLLDPWSLGATALIPAPGTTLQMLPLLLKRHDATLFASAPGVYRQILKHNAKLDLPRLRHGLSAGEKLSETLRAAFREASGREIYEAYGMSECSTFLSASPAVPAAPDSLGTAQVGRCIALLGPDGPVPRGETGEIAVHRGDPGLMRGYVGAPEATAARLRGDWFLTGDLGVMDADGQVAYRGRADDMMNAGGFRVSPAEVEAALARVPGIEAVAVTDVEIRPDVRIIAAFYTGPAPLETTMLEAEAARHLARYKQPRLYRHVDSLPTGPNGKLSRRALRDSFAPDSPGET